MPGAGKSTASMGLVASGWERVVMGDVVREETRRRGLEPNARNTGEVMKDLRRSMGEAAVAKLSLERVSQAGAEKVVVDGIRSVAEVDEFRKAGRTLLIVVHASPRRRFELLKERGRSDDPLSVDMFLERDRRELGVGIGSAIALADEVVSNERNTPRGLSEDTMAAVNRWLKADAQ